MAHFDFDHWADLARRDPSAFFHARERAIAGFIDEHPDPQARRLREIQDQIDCVRALSANPSQATRELTAMLEDHLAALREAMDRLLALTLELGRGVEGKGAGH